MLGGHHPNLYPRGYHRPVSLADIFTMLEDDPAEIVAAADLASGELIAGWIARPEWMARAACRAPDVNPAWFFPRRGASLAPARSVCETCPVAAACLRMALDDPDLDGIWAGTTAPERREIRRSAA